MHTPVHAGGDRGDCHHGRLGGRGHADDLSDRVGDGTGGDLLTAPVLSRDRSSATHHLDAQASAGRARHTGRAASVPGHAPPAFRRRSGRTHVAVRRGSPSPPETELDMQPTPSSRTAAVARGSRLSPPHQASRGPAGDRRARAGVHGCAGHASPVPIHSYSRGPSCGWAARMLSAPKPTPGTQRRLATGPRRGVGQPASLDMVL